MVQANCLQLREFPNEADVVVKRSIGSFKSERTLNLIDSVCNDYRLKTLPLKLKPDLVCTCGLNPYLVTFNNGAFRNQI